VATVSRPRSRRSANGQPGSQPPLRLGPPGRRRQPALIVLGVALMLVAAAVAGALYLRVGNRVPVLMVNRPVEAGAAITDADLAEVRVATDTRVATIPAGERAAVVGQFALAPLPEGSLLTRGQLTPQAVPGEGQAKVGVVLQPGQLPAEDLAPGDRVAVVAARAAGTETTGGPPPGKVLVAEARVYGQRRSEASEAVVVTLVVRQADAATVVRYGAAGQVGLAVLPAAGGGTVPDATDPAAAPGAR
jgi:hypothetical protein